MPFRRSACARQERDDHGVYARPLRVVGRLVLAITLAGYAVVAGFALLVAGAVALNGLDVEAPGFFPSYAVVVVAAVLAASASALKLLFVGSPPSGARTSRWARAAAATAGSGIVLAGALAAVGLSYGKAASDYCLDNIPVQYLREGARIGGATFDSPVHIRCAYDGESHVRTDSTLLARSAVATGAAVAVAFVLWRRVPSGATPGSRTPDR